MKSFTGSAARKIDTPVQAPPVKRMRVRTAEPVYESQNGAQPAPYKIVEENLSAATRRAIALIDPEKLGEEVN